MRPFLGGRERASEGRERASEGEREREGRERASEGERERVWERESECPVSVCRRGEPPPTKVSSGLTKVSSGLTKVSSGLITFLLCENVM